MSIIHNEIGKIEIKNYLILLFDTAENFEYFNYKNVYESIINSLNNNCYIQSGELTHQFYNYFYEFSKSKYVQVIFISNVVEKEKKSLIELAKKSVNYKNYIDNTESMLNKEKILSLINKVCPCDMVIKSGKIIVDRNPEYEDVSFEYLKKDWTCILSLENYIPDLSEIFLKYKNDAVLVDISAKGFFSEVKINFSLDKIEIYNIQNMLTESIEELGNLCDNSTFNLTTLSHMYGAKIEAKNQLFTRILYNHVQCIERLSKLILIHKGMSNKKIKKFGHDIVKLAIKSNDDYANLSDHAKNYIELLYEYYKFKRYSDLEGNVEIYHTYQVKLIYFFKSINSCFSNSFFPLNNLVYNTTFEFRFSKILREIFSKYFKLLVKHSQFPYTYELINDCCWDKHSSYNKISRKLVNIFIKLSIEDSCEYAFEFFVEHGLIHNTYIDYCAEGSFEDIVSRFIEIIENIEIIDVFETCNLLDNEETISELDDVVNRASLDYISYILELFQY